METKIEEAVYPTEFDVNHFRSLTTFKARLEYVKNKLGKLGQGSSRVVFDVDNDTVLKLARNKKGLEQNKLEAEVGRLGWYDFVAKTLGYDDNGLWLESEKARKMKPSDFLKMTGVSFKDFVGVLAMEYNRVFGARNNALSYSSVPKEVKDKILELDLLQNILQYVGDYQIDPRDLYRISSWGVVNRDGVEKPILIDFGLSKDIYKDFYAKR